MTKEDIDRALRAEFPELIQDYRLFDQGIHPSTHYLLTKQLYLERVPKGADYQSLEACRAVLDCAREAARRLAPGA